MLLQRSAILCVLMFFHGMLQAQLWADGDTTICQGGSAQLTSGGGGVSYFWTSVPNDPSLLIPQQQNPIVSPQVSTMYIVQSNIATGNLILNGSFELGVMGFSSQYVNNQVSIVDEGTYAVVNDAHTVHPNFFCNHDHTSGSGKMMATNGSGVQNVKVWYHTLTNVRPNTRYEFSTWITSLHETNPALLQFSINGELMDEPFQAYPYTCDWYQFFYIWDSDTNEQATISIVNQNTILSGNDFALDDISFATVLVYYDTVYVEVLPQFNSPFSAPSEACAQQVITVDYLGNAPDTASFHWDFDGAVVLSGSGPGPYELIYPAAGNPVISLWVEGDGCPSDTTLHGLSVGESPVVEAYAEATIIPYGNSTTLHGSFEGGLGPFEFSWDPADLLTDPSSLDPSTLALEYTTSFILSVTDLSAGCTASDTVVVQVAGGPLGVSLTADPDHLCPGEQSVLTAQGLGGTENYTYSWTSDPPGFESSLPEVTVQPDATTEYFVSVNDGLSEVSESVLVFVNENPMAYAGIDITVPYGAYASLQGEGVGGSGIYSYHWEPSDLVVSPNDPETQTQHLMGTTVFTLMVTDLVTGCPGIADEVVVFIEGGPLAVIIDPDQAEICEGDTVRLTALASGGNPPGYTYSWTDNFGNSHSSTQSISVILSQTTVFNVSVNDGFNVMEAFQSITVYPSTAFTWTGGQDFIYACPLETVDLVPDPNPPGWNFLWSNGSTENHLVIGSTGIGFDLQTITLTTSNDDGCEFSSSITVIFDFSHCSGMKEESGREFLRVSPNPSQGSFILSLEGGEDLSSVTIHDGTGREVFRRESCHAREIEVDLGEGASGIFVIRALTSGQRFYNRLILVR
jgi:hypothetical protein